MAKNWRSEWPHWAILVAMFVAGAIAWPRVPERVPVHWGFDGQVDRYGGRFEGVWLLPLVALGLYILLRVLPRFDPGQDNYTHFAGAYGLIRLATLGILAGIYTLSLLAATGREPDVARIVPMLIGGLFIAIGSVLGKLRPTWFTGIRTPWTLSSARSWGKTHRLGGRVFIGMGLLLILGGALRLPALTATALVLVALAMVGLYGYSYLVWRQDHGAVPPAGRRPAEER